MVSVCLPSDALLQHLIWVSLTLAGVSLHGCSSKAQPLLFTLDEGYLLTTPVPDLQCGIAPLRPPVPAQPLLLELLLPAAAPGLGLGWLLRVTAPDLGRVVSPPGHHWWTGALSAGGSGGPAH